MPSLTPEEKARALREVAEAASPERAYYLFLMLSLLIAAVGFVQDHVVLIIASMLIAPLLFPLLALGVGVLLSEPRIIRRSLATILRSVGLGVGVGMVVGFFVTPQTLPSLFHLTVPSLGSLTVAAAAGIAVVYTLLLPRRSAQLPGIALAVSLLPPLAVAGLSLAWGEWRAVADAFALFLINVGAVVASVVIVFALVDVRDQRPVIEAVASRQRQPPQSSPAGASHEADYE